MTPDVEKLRKSPGRIKKRVRDQTADLVKVNKKLRTEIAQHEWAEKELGLLLSITRSIHEARSFHSALEIALEKVCKATGWSFGEAWVPRSDGTVLECSPAWYGEGNKLRTFRNLTVGMTFARGVGLPGRVWQSKQPDWISIPSIMVEEVFQRAEIAAECGLKAALGVPILVDDEVLAVLVFFMPESLEKSRRKIDLVFAVAIQLGSFFKQKRAEEELGKGRRELENRVQERTAELAKANEALKVEINKRMQAADATRESQRTLSTLMSNLPGMAYRCRNDRDWTMEFVSEGCVELTGYQSSDLIGNKKLSFSQLIHPDDRERLWDEVQEALRQRKPFQLIYRITTAGGEEKWVWEHGRGVFSAGGHLRALEGFATDITERVRNREALQEEKDFAESLIETAQVIILVLDHEGRIVRFNPYMEKLSGYRLEEVQGREWVSTFLPERERDRIRGLFGKVMKQEETHGVNPIVTKEGREREIDWSNTTLKDSQGNVIGVLAIGQDITEKTRLQEHLLEIERLAAIGATTAKLAHEIGNPLNGMYLTVQLLQQQLSRHDDIRDDKVVSTVAKLENEIVRLNRLLMEFRSLSRAETYQFRRVSLGKILTDVLEIEKLRYTALGIHVEQDFPDDLPVMVADGDRLKQAFLNLCKNASEAMPEGGTLTVKARQSGDEVVVEITDTGGGIPEGMDITQPFATTKLQGSGIGLVVVRQIIAAHGGSLAYSSEAGQGTTCRLTLPLYPISAESP